VHVCLRRPRGPCKTQKCRNGATETHHVAQTGVQHEGLRRPRGFKRHEIIFHKVIQDAIFYLNASLHRHRG